MRLAMIIGLSAGEQIKKRLQGVKDNLDIDCFDTVSEFIDTSIKRSAVYDRVVVLAKLLSDVALQDLFNFWNKRCHGTQIVMMGKAGVDEGCANRFNEVFVTTVTAAILLKSTTVTLVAEAVLRPIPDLIKDYGVKQDSDVELADSFSIDLAIDTDHVVEPDAGEAVKPVEKKSHPKPKKEKKGLFGLFGGKSKNENKKVKKEEPPEEYSDSQDESCEETYESTYREPEVNKDYSTSVDTEETIEETSYNEQKMNFESNFYENLQVKGKAETLSDTSNTGQEILQEAVDIGSVDLDFSGLMFTEPEIKESGVAAVASVEDVDFSSMNLSQAEKEYRNEVEQPKVITKTVIKEVPVGKASGGRLNALNGVYKGKLKKVIVVTGDRGTGITSTALSLAQVFSKHVDVLYFDCDIKNHGLMNYIDYGTFQSYSETHMNGVKMCRNARAFEQCVVSYTDSLYLLTTDFSCDCNGLELKTAAEVVSELVDEFGVVVVDCPVDNLQYIEDLVYVCQGIMCVEGSKRGFMNMLCQFEASPLAVKYKKALLSRGTMFATKCTKNLDLNKLVGYIKSIYEPDSVDWLCNNPQVFYGKLTDQLLNDILEG